MFEISLQTIALCILGPLVVIYILKHILSWFHEKKSAVDEFQKMVSRAAGVCRQAQLPLLENVLTNVAALDYDDAIPAIGLALNKVDTMPELMVALQENFVWQFDHRGKTDEGVKLIVNACLDNQAIRAGISTGLEAEEEAAASVALLKKAKAAITPTVV